MKGLPPWYASVVPRKEVREGRSFNPDEFAIALEQVVTGTAPEDYRDPAKFFSRTCYTKALKEHSGMALRRLAGETANTAPVLTLITQFGGGKTHTLAALYHMVANAKESARIPEVMDLVKEAGLSKLPAGKTAVFVGNAWDPEEGLETPWIDMAYQLAGKKGVEALGKAAKTTPPGTKALQKVFDAAGAPVLVLFDEALNFLNRHRDMADSFHAFIQNLTVAMTGAANGAAIISLPRSSVEMSDWDEAWQDKINKVVRRIAKDLIANDETEISEVVRKRLFESLGDEKVMKRVAKTYADWCFERRAQLPPEWTAVDTTATEAKAREFLKARFETCYPFHPATLSVFQRKWQSLKQYQQTRGTLAMFAQWIARVFKEDHMKARTEPLLTLGSAPLEIREFQSIVLGQLGESRLATAIDTDISAMHSHARALDADTKGPLRDIHRRVGTAILFESSGGQVDKVAHLPELRFALAGPDLDTASVDNAANALENKAFFISKVGTDGYKVYHKATVKKAVSDRRASLDEEQEVKPRMQEVVKSEFGRGATTPFVWFPEDGAAIHDSPKLTLVVMPPDMEWTGSKQQRAEMLDWMRNRGQSPRLYPGAIVICFKKPGLAFRDKVAMWLAWGRVQKEILNGTLGTDYDKTDKADIAGKAKEAETDAKDEVWGAYRHVVIIDSQREDGLKVIDLGAGHSSGAETMCGRVIGALKSQGLLNETIGEGYIDRYWPKAFEKSGAWPLTGLRQSFLNGSLTRLLDPDNVLRSQIVSFVDKSAFGLASGLKPDGAYNRLWFDELIALSEVEFDNDVYLLKPDKAKALRSGGDAKEKGAGDPEVAEESAREDISTPEPEPVEQGADPVLTAPSRISLSGNIPPEVWNRLGTKLIPKLKSGDELEIGLSIKVSVAADRAQGLKLELKQMLDDLGLGGQIEIG